MAAAAGQSLNERAFILQALAKSQLRVDGRGTHDMRPIRLSFGRDQSTSFAEVQLGRTRVRVVVTSEIVRPYPDRPVEGFLSFNVDPISLRNASSSSSVGNSQRKLSERRAVHLTVSLMSLFPDCVFVVCCLLFVVFACSLPSKYFYSLTNLFHIYETGSWTLSTFFFFLGGTHTHRQSLRTVSVKREPLIQKHYVLLRVRKHGRFIVRFMCWMMVGIL